MPIIKADNERLEKLLGGWFKECQPKILVVTDSLSFVEKEEVGLTEFVATLRASTIHGRTPRVTTAKVNPDIVATLSYDPDTGHISNYKFTDRRYGVSIAHYDVVFLLANNRQEQHPLLTDEVGALAAIETFMRAGGGLFATGDHEDLGAGMCQAIPRVRSMRHWTEGTPSADKPDRLSTVSAGRGDQLDSNDQYEPSDQSDRFPQRLFVNFLTEAGRTKGDPLTKFAHPLLQVPGDERAIEVFPDHINEGACIAAPNLGLTLTSGEREWPLDSDGSGVPIAPEMVALSMSHGNGVLTRFGRREAVAPRSFIAIAAYDGQLSNVGRVVTDATYHHFTNENIQPGQARLGGRDLRDIKQYYTNLATWLMPRRVRRCLRSPLLLQEFLRSPLFEELAPAVAAKLDGPRARELGVLVEGALLGRHTRAEVDALLSDALEDAIGPSAQRQLEALDGDFGAITARGAALAALGGLAVATAERFNALVRQDEFDGEEAFADTGKASTSSVWRYLASTRDQLGKLHGMLSAIAG